jgi:hypothetical protein
MFSKQEKKLFRISDLEQLLECPVCLEVPHSTPIYQVIIIQVSLG